MRRSTRRADQEIARQARVNGEGLAVAVTDHGPGLDPAELDHLFERFYRGRTARQTSFGTGMGLSITRGLLAAAGRPRLGRERAGRRRDDSPLSCPARCVPHRSME